MFEVTVNTLTSTHHQAFCSEHGQVGMFRTHDEALAGARAHADDAHATKRADYLTKGDRIVHPELTSEVVIVDSLAIRSWGKVIIKFTDGRTYHTHGSRAVRLAPAQRFTPGAVTGSPSPKFTAGQSLVYRGEIVSFRRYLDGMPDHAEVFTSRGSVLAAVSELSPRRTVIAWPSLYADQVPAGTILPDGVQAEPVEVRWTVPGVVGGTEFVHRFMARDESDVRRQIGRDHLRPGVPVSSIRILGVRPLLAYDQVLGKPQTDR